MALPLAHAAAGYLAYEACRPAEAHRVGWLVAAVILANAPDVDFLPGLALGAPEAFHRGVTHTTGAVVTVALLAAMLGRRCGVTSWRAARFAALAYGSHLLVDFLSADAVPPAGGPFLWPFSDAYWIAARPWLPEVILDRSSPGAFLGGLLGAEAARVWVTEGLLLAAVVVGVRAVRALGHARVVLSTEATSGR
ncbi:MAG: metal-dependent hydrolase [Candidatus Binatia bacterium]